MALYLTKTAVAPASVMSRARSVTICQSFAFIIIIIISLFAEKLEMITK